MSGQGRLTLDLHTSVQIEPHETFGIFRGTRKDLARWTQQLQTSARSDFLSRSSSNGSGCRIRVGEAETGLAGTEDTVRHSGQPEQPQYHIPFKICGITQHSGKQTPAR
jgi:hypothetical protein